jgi:hypothetical protein
MRDIKACFGSPLDCAGFEAREAVLVADLTAADAS